MLLPATLDELHDFLHWSPSGQPLIAAHRGAPQANEAENALATFDSALARGACFLEIDVRKSRDGHFVLNHDAALDRTTTGAGPLAQRTLAELQSLRLRDLSGAVTDQVMPTLAQTLRWARGKALLYVDVKPPVTYEEVQIYLHEQHAESICVTLTFDIKDTLAVHRASPRAAIYAMVPEERRVRELLDCGIPHRQLIGSIQYHTPKAMYDLLHEHGIRVDYPAWAGTDTRASSEGPDVYLPALANGADIFNTDQVRLVCRAIESTGA